jgi:branched-chain amino acid transport system permease protein
LNLINGFAGQFSLGHAGFMAVGAYTSALITTSIGITRGSVWAGPALAVALLLGGAVAALFGLLVGIPSLRLKGDYLAITTLGFGEIIRVIVQNLNFLGGARGFTGIPKLSNMFWVFSTVAFVIFLIYNLINSTYGKAFLAVRDDEIAAEAVGISSTRVKVVAFITGAFFAGVAGGLYAHFVTYINPMQFSFLKSFEIVVMVIIGGMGSIIGVILSATLLTILPEALRSVAQYRMVIYSLLLIIIMITRPQGLFIRRRTAKQNVAPKIEIS